MPQDTLFDPAYRLWHLRRFWQLCLIPPMLGILCAILYPSNISGLATPTGAALGLGLWAVGSATYLIFWPRLPLEVFALSLSLAAIFAIVPAIAVTDPGLMPWVALVLPVLALAMVIAAARVLNWMLFIGPGVGRHFTAHAESCLAPEEVIAALRLRGGLSGPMLQTGPMASDGQFTLCLPAPPELQPILHSSLPPDRHLHGSWECFARIIDESPRHQLQAIIPKAEPHKETRILLRAEPSNAGSTVSMDEFETDLPLGCAILFRLIGLHEDYLRARVDRAEGRPSPAIRFAALNSPLLMLARWMARKRATNS
jgi:hypothetical protein